MKDEEMAEDYAKGLCKTCTVDTCRYSTIQTCAIKESIKQAHFDGLKAGKGMNVPIKWHDLRKDPNDLPESYMSILNQDGEKVMYDYSCKVWRCDDADEYICDTPIAWCEIPEYTEE